MIYKGSNQPIRLEVDFDANSIVKLSCVLYNKRKSLKHWTLEDVLIEDETLILPLSEEETINFPACKAELEMKWLMQGNIEFAQIMPLMIIDRRDTTLLTGDDGNEG